MRRRVESFVISCVVAVLLGSCAARQKPAVDTAAIKSAIADFNQKFEAAVAARDTDAVASSYSDDAHLLPAGSPRADGREAIRAAWVQFLGTPGLSLKFTSSEVMVAEAGDVAIDVGAYQMSMADPKGQPMVDIGKYVTVLKKVGDEWKIVVDTFNSDQRPPGA